MASIVVWIRLSKLPIEYYDMEVLKQIGKYIGNVLRINTHTASESRGRYARLCIQVDVEKPLTTSLIIGGIKQPISYEGIHKISHVSGLSTREMHVRSWYAPPCRRRERKMSCSGIRKGQHARSMIQGPTGIS